MRPRDGKPNGIQFTAERDCAVALPQAFGRDFADRYYPEPSPNERNSSGFPSQPHLFLNTSSGPAFLVGFAAEARVARLSGWHVAIGGGSTEGAAREAQSLIDAGASGIVSFGLAGGLDPTLPAGALIVAEAVAANGQVWRTDRELSARLGGTTGHLCLGLDHVAASAAEKKRLGRDTGAALVDMESGAVAAVASAAGVPFAVLRAICDPADRVLPPAALVALDPEGRLAAAQMAMSILTGPGQIWGLMKLARDAAAARRALRTRAIRIASQGIEQEIEQSVSGQHGIPAEWNSPLWNVPEEIL